MTTEDKFNIFWSYWWVYTTTGGRKFGDIFSPIDKSPSDVRMAHIKLVMAAGSRAFTEGIENKPMSRPRGEFKVKMAERMRFYEVFYRAGTLLRTYGEDLTIHYHLCPKCFFVWSHPNAIACEKDKVRKAAHICTKCGQKEVLDKLV